MYKMVNRVRAVTVWLTSLELFAWAILLSNICIKAALCFELVEEVGDIKEVSSKSELS
jgi:hypothetical protein